MPKLGGPPPGVSGSNHPFVYLASSYSTAAGNVPPPDQLQATNQQLGSAPPPALNAEFRDLCIAVSAVVPKHAAANGPAPPPPGPGPAPSPPGSHGLGLATCDANDARQLWTFSGSHS